MKGGLIVTACGLLVFCLLFSNPPLASAGVLYEANPANYRIVLKKLAPGDTLVLRAGVYRRGLPIHYLNGSVSKPIVIRGPASGDSPLFLARPGHNTISIINSSYVTIRGLELDGRGLAVNGVKAEGHADWAHHITLEKLIIRNHDANQQIVAISTKCPAWAWVIRDNVISRAGTGMYLGNSDGSDPFIGGLIEYNLITETLGYNLQIKHQQARPDIPGMPHDKQSTIIRHNVFSKARGNGRDEMARPNVLVGHWPLRGPGVDDTYQIYGNFFYQNPQEALFQGEGNIALYNNLFVNYYGDAVHIQPHNDIPRNVDVFYNTILAATAGIIVRNRQNEKVRYAQRIIANAVFASFPISGGQQLENLTGDYLAAGNYLTNPFGALGEMDLYPSFRDARAKIVAAKQWQDYTDWDRDFNGAGRHISQTGAYMGEVVNPGWRPKLARKPRFVQ